MGGKKKKTHLGPIKKESKYKIPSRFDCPVCDSKASISVKISRQSQTARIFCTRCLIGSETTMRIKPLERNVDIFFKFREELLALDHVDNGSSSLSYANSMSSENTSGFPGPQLLNGLGRGEPMAELSRYSRSSTNIPEVSDAVDFFGPTLDDEDELDPFR